VRYVPIPNDPTLYREEEQGILECVSRKKNKKKLSSIIFYDEMHFVIDFYFIAFAVLVAKFQL
jgi:GH43 family beta-xylosidase